MNQFNLIKAGQDARLDMVPKKLEYLFCVCLIQQRFTSRFPFEACIKALLKRMDGKPSRSTIDLNKETLELEADSKEPRKVIDEFKQKYAQAMNDLKVLERTLAYQKHQQKLAKADPGCSNKAMTPATERSVEVKATIPSKMKVEPIVLVNSRVNKRTNNELQEFFWGEETKTRIAMHHHGGKAGN
ncbi:hypothetical protein DAPPUDRAFT_248574 [Daphnia pulex]|uniref:Uncharacterized protein n=1 Tax=Daphnia pulex TaxID=6669 RepID=E9GUF1_DAPPU|nr:hypothetical protein DAPPUDRAFT_248574 [Daphnia pulex]|eukprot:EFX76821.1 hypothetical protein DAPPUDRAFT_248574 [Daphnia pulex]